MGVGSGCHTPGCGGTPGVRGGGYTPRSTHTWGAHPGVLEAQHTRGPAGTVGTHRDLDTLGHWAPSRDTTGSAPPGWARRGPGGLRCQGARPAPQPGCAGGSRVPVSPAAPRPAISLLRTTDASPLTKSTAPATSSLGQRGVAPSSPSCHGTVHRAGDGDETRANRAIAGTCLPRNTRLCPAQHLDAFLVLRSCLCSGVRPQAPALVSRGFPSTPARRHSAAPQGSPSRPESSGLRQQRGRRGR